MDSMIRLLGVVNRTPPGNPMAALEDIFFLLQNEESADVVVLPRMALTAPSSGDIFLSGGMQKATEEALLGLLLRSREVPGFIVLTVPFYEGGIITERLVLIHKGERYVADIDSPATFRIGALSVAVVAESAVKLPRRIPELVASGCQLIISLSYDPVFAGSMDNACRAIECVSASVNAAVMAVGGGVGDTSSPLLYGGFVLLAEEGACSAYCLTGIESSTLAYDLDVDMLPTPEVRPKTPYLAERDCEGGSTGVLRPINKTPYLPRDSESLSAYLGEVFALQCRALAARLDNTGLKTLVLGVSGGLDSTLALLVCAGTCDLLGLPRNNILGVTMPGFGTGDRTYYNALKLMQELGIEMLDIPIKNSVSVHFEDIGQNPAKRDSTYENAQARERTQILFDLSNQRQGLVVGTGDLSEAALGFCTFGGDHLAGYNVNISINKTTIRSLVLNIARSGVIEGVGDTLSDILDTPVSPELLPVDDSGETTQKSENILGPYILHDFFLYHTLTNRLLPKKLLGYATIAFADEFEPEFIKSTLKTFISRFYTSQFKRSCSPDAADVCRPNLNFYSIPSDMSPQLFLTLLEGEGEADEV